VRTWWSSGAPEEVTELDAKGRPVTPSVSAAEDLVLRTAALGVCAYSRCGGPQTEIWSAGWSQSTVIHADGGAAYSWTCPPGITSATVTPDFSGGVGEAGGDTRFGPGGGGGEPAERGASGGSGLAVGGSVGGGGGGSDPVRGESWRFCSREHMEAGLAERGFPDFSGGAGPGSA
jgi:hypothetical protein